MNLSPHKSRQDWTCRRFIVVKVKVCEEKKKEGRGKKPWKERGKEPGQTESHSARQFYKDFGQTKVSIWEALLPSSTGLPQYPSQARPAVYPSIWLGAASAVVDSEHRN